VQHVADWIEMFKPICDVTWLSTAGNELAKAGHPLPPPSPNARAHAARLKAQFDAEAAAAAAPAPEPEPAAAPVPESQASAEDDADSDISDVEGAEMEAEEVYPDEDYDELTEQALSMRDELVYTRHELRAFKVVHRSTAGKLRRRLGRKTDRLKAVESKLGNDPDKLEFMRKVNRELADAQRKLLNLQYTWTNMEAEVSELEWGVSKGKEELEQVKGLGDTLASELTERRVEQEETDAELLENKEILTALKLEHKRASGEMLDGTSREDLVQLKSKLGDARAAIQKLLEEKQAS